MKKETQKMVFSSILAIATLLLVAFLWKNILFLTTLLAVTSILMLTVEKEKTAVYLYAIAFLLGPLAESVAIYSGVWSYTHAHVLGFPWWLPLIWGNAGLFFRRVNLFLNHPPIS